MEPVQWLGVYTGKEELKLIGLNRQLPDIG
jgi:hypothetical protein